MQPIASKPCKPRETNFALTEFSEVRTAPPRKTLPSFVGKVALQGIYCACTILCVRGLKQALHRGDKESFYSRPTRPRTRGVRALGWGVVTNKGSLGRIHPGFAFLGPDFLAALCVTFGTSLITLHEVGVLLGETPELL